jgi:hypothetical protein
MGCTLTAWAKNFLLTFQCFPFTPSKDGGKNLPKGFLRINNGLIKTKIRIYYRKSFYTSLKVASMSGVKKPCVKKSFRASVARPGIQEKT